MRRISNIGARVYLIPDGPDFQDFQDGNQETQERRIQAGQEPPKLGENEWVSKIAMWSKMKGKNPFTRNQLMQIFKIEETGITGGSKVWVPSTSNEIQTVAEVDGKLIVRGTQIDSKGFLAGRVESIGDIRFAWLATYANFQKLRGIYPNLESWQEPTGIRENEKHQHFLVQKEKEEMFCVPCIVWNYMPNDGKGNPSQHGTTLALIIENESDKMKPHHGFLDMQGNRWDYAIPVDLKERKMFNV